MSDLADKILEYRGKNNLSQKKFAELCGVTEQTICYVERNLQKPSRLTEKKILLVIEKEAE